jgi:hypothetical protein
MQLAAVHESVPGTNRRFAAVQCDACNGGEADLRRMQPAQPRVILPGALTSLAGWRWVVKRLG